MLQVKSIEDLGNLETLIQMIERIEPQEGPEYDGQWNTKTRQRLYPEKELYEELLKELHKTRDRWRVWI